MDQLVGKNVFFCDSKNNCVNQGVVMTTTVSQSGYVVHIIIDSQKKQHNVESNLVFLNEKDAIDFLPTFLQVKDKMEAVNKELTSQLDELRTQIIGNPEVKDVADSIYR